MITFIRRAIFVIVLLLMIGSSDYSNDSYNTIRESEDRIENYLTTANDYTAVKYYADRYSFTYDIPLPILHKLLETETGWGLVKPERYEAHQVGDRGKSFGPGQIQVATAKRYRNDANITSQRLLYDIKFNIETICIILDHDRNYYGQLADDKETMWLYVLSSYNMGRYGFQRRDMEPNTYAKNIVLAYNS